MQRFCEPELRLNYTSQCKTHRFPCGPGVGLCSSSRRRPEVLTLALPKDTRGKPGIKNFQHRKCPQLKLMQDKAVIDSAFLMSVLMFPWFDSGKKKQNRHWQVYRPCPRHLRLRSSSSFSADVNLINASVILILHPVFS